MFGPWHVDIKCVCRFLSDRHDMTSPAVSGDVPSLDKESHPEAPNDTPVMNEKTSESGASSTQEAEESEGGLAAWSTVVAAYVHC